MLSLHQATEEAKVLADQHVMQPISFQYAAHVPQDGRLVAQGWEESPATDWKQMCNLCIDNIHLTLNYHLEHHELDPTQTCYWTLSRQETVDGTMQWFWKVVYFPFLAQQDGPGDKTHVN